MMNPQPSPKQYRGCLIGQCLGDATGCRVEGYPAFVCKNYVQYELRNKQPRDRDRFPFPFGQYTDDSQMARELLSSYVELGRFCPDDYARRIVALFTENRIVGRGRTTEAAVERLALGVPWQEAGTPSPSAGNGSAMRAAPVGLMFYDHPQQLIQVAHQQGLITHQDPRCSGGSIAIAGAVAFVLQNQSFSPEHFIAQISQWVQEVSPELATEILRLNQWIELPSTPAFELISRAGLDPDYRSEWDGISPFVVGSVLWSLYSFLRTPNDYWETICTAIAVGGDVDTTAAMAGAISGAYLGLDAIPLDLAKQLNDRGSWKYTELLELADRCYNLKFKKE
ncbi:MULTISPECIES: ADP-ribosylglycohydrolase family protein [Planktothrix]|uniref:ADP-ribosylglycohydrolase family protein n=1 Tax=Planktothrix TaxID=54304 RepID=UPI00047D50D3|nr:MULTISPECIES: ADP-ribosylglycohydrolase family protein [Planktothrix]